MRLSRFSIVSPEQTGRSRESPRKEKTYGWDKPERDYRTVSTYGARRTIDYGASNFCVNIAFFTYNTSQLDV